MAADVGTSVGSESRHSFTPPARLDIAEHIGILALLVTWVVPLASASGGEGAAQQQSAFGIVAVAALFLVRGWRAPAGSTLAAAMLAIAALLVCVFAPSGWSGADVAAGYGIAAATYLVARRYARTEHRRVVLVIAICIGGMYQFIEAFGPWVAAGQPDAEMSGLLGGHNAFAAFLLPAAIAGIGVAARFAMPWSLLGWITAPLCAAGIVFSTSRATVAALLAAAALLLTVALVRRRHVGRVLSVLALAAVVTVLMPGPPLFSHRVSPFAATDARAAAGETLDQNGSYRLAFWRDAAEVAWHRPLVGAGYDTLETASVPYVPPGQARSPNAHSGYLQALSDGGLLLGLPLLFAVVMFGWWSFRRLWAAARTVRDPSTELIGVATALALLAAFAHSAVDADWTYPAILVETALLGAVLAPAPRAAGGRYGRWVAAPAAFVAASVLVVEIFALHQWQLDASPVGQSPATLLARSSATFGDYRPADWLLRRVADGRISIPRMQAARALSLTADAAKVSLYVALRRFQVGALTGLIPDAVPRARAALAPLHGEIRPYLLDLAAVEANAGDRTALRETLGHDLSLQVESGIASAEAASELVMWARELGQGRSYACELRAVRGLKDAPDIMALPPATHECQANEPPDRRVRRSS